MIRTIRCSVAICSLFLPAAAALPGGSELGYTVSVSDKLVNQFAARFGNDARFRLLKWRVFARTGKAETNPEDLLLGVVNDFFNQLPFVSDLSHWGIDDYWATPAEALASNGADCEDFAIAKYFLLKELGVPIAKLRITYVMARPLNQAHMVLAYYASPQSEPLILDNLEDSVLPASRRPDLVPVYSFNDDELTVVQRGRLGNPVQIRKWRDLLMKLEGEAAI